LKLIGSFSKREFSHPKFPFKTHQNTRPFLKHIHFAGSKEREEKREKREERETRETRERQERDKRETRETRERQERDKRETRETREKGSIKTKTKTVRRGP